jgi:hypothetical protein
MWQSTEAAESGPPKSGARLPQPVANGNFVINLSASTTPVALVQPSHPDLKNFTFFVSRRREDRRERFRLHMGYFQSQQDAENLLEVVREIFPAAWAGIAPGQRLHDAEAMATRQPLLPAGHELPSIEVAMEPVPAAVPAILELVVEPEATVNFEFTAAEAAVEVSPPVAMTPALPPPAEPPTLAAAVAPPASIKQVERIEAAQSLDSVRAAIASLDDSSLATPTELTLLSDSQTLKMLEKAPGAANQDAVSKQRAELAGFAVQLKWSVQPIDTHEIPGLAIFDAYTLYGAEGNRDGRRWYALRLGFFSDSASARQVAQYVRSEFSSVTVVPIANGERERALQAATQALPVATAPAAASKSRSGEFRLLEDAPAAVPATPASPVAAVAGKPAKPVNDAGARRPPMSLEETLEILGANDLRLNTKGDGLLNGATARAMQHAAERREPPRSKLGKLFERLAGMNS